MDPRLPSSKKFTPFPKEYVDQITEVFGQSFKPNIDKGDLIIEGKIYPHEVLLRVGYLEEGRLVQANFEVSIEYDPKKQNAVKTIYLAIDCAASMMDNYFQADDDNNFPRIWEKQDVNGQDVYLQYSRVNSKLEAQADELLGEYANEGLVQYHEGEEDEELKQGVIKILGLDDEDKEEKH